MGQCSIQQHYTFHATGAYGRDLALPVNDELLRNTVDSVQSGRGSFWRFRVEITTVSMARE